MVRSLYSHATATKRFTVQADFGRQHQPSTPVHISYAFLAEFFSYRQIAESITPKLLESFTEEFLEEVPPGNLIIDVHLVDRWYEREAAREMPYVFAKELTSI